MVKRGFKVLDSDIHVQEPPDLWGKYMEPKFRDKAPKLLIAGGVGTQNRWESGGKILPAYGDDPHRIRTINIRKEKAQVRHAKLGRPAMKPEEGQTPDQMIAAMEIEGIDVSVVFRTMAAHFIAIEGMDPQLSAAICRAFNHWLRDFCDADADRLKLAALMPMHDVTLAVHEASRAVSELGAICLVVPSNPVNGRQWYDEYYHPFWEEVERLGVPVAFHGIQMAYQDHIGNRYKDNFALAHASAHCLEMMLALGAMITGGVLERFPGLKAAFLEGHCSWLPSWLYVLEERMEKFGDTERFGTKLSPQEYFQRQCYVSVDPDEWPLKYTIDALGDDNIVISTDWPHDDSSFPQATETFLGLPDISEDSQQKILWDNCARLYHVT